VPKYLWIFIGVAVLVIIRIALFSRAGAVGADAPASDAPPGFTIVLRGYDREAVDAAIAAAEEALASGDPARRAAVAQQLATADFTVVLRGYDRFQVDDHLKRLRTELA